MIFLAAVLGFGGFVLWHGLISPHARHTRLLGRINVHAQAVITALRFGNSPTGGDHRTRVEAMKAVSTALWNPLYYRERCNGDVLRRIADRLDRTKAAELQSAEGCLRLMDEIEEACPTVKDYTWFENFRRMQAEGTVAKLPAK